MSKNKKNKKTSSFSDRCRMNSHCKRYKWLKVLNMAIIILLVLFSVSYVLIINDLSVKGFVLRDAKLKVAELKEKNEMLRIKTMQLEGYENIATRADDLKMVKVDKIEYLAISDLSMAKK